MKIYPDYDLLRGKWSIDLETYVRKQDDEGIWRLIPIRQKYELTKKLTPKIRIQSTLDVIKIFTEYCYRVQLFWKFGKKIQIMEPPYILEPEVDENQQPENERLLINNYLV